MQGTRYTPRSDVSSLGDQVFIAPNEPYGVLISYYVEEPLANGERAELTISDSIGTPVRTLKGPAQAGINRVVWNLREDLSMVTNGGVEDAGFIRGPRALPGSYTVRLSAAGQALEQPFRVRLDPNIEVSRDALVAHYRAVRRLMRMQHAIGAARDQIQAIDRQIVDLKKRVSEEAIIEQANAVQDELEAIEYQFDVPDRLWETTAEDGIINLQGRVGWLVRQMGEYTGRPTAAQAEWVDTFDRQLDTVLATLDAVIQGPLAELNDRLADAETPRIDPDGYENRGGVRHVP